MKRLGYVRGGFGVMSIGDECGIMWKDGGSILTSILCVVDKLINDTKNKFEILGKDREAV
jgi:hypothetical protein